MSDPLPPAVVRAPDFPPGLDWLFTVGPASDASAASDQHAAPNAPALTLADLRGAVVVVDLWTYGCINCQHVLATLAAREARFPRELVVVGVHSGKFVAERDTGRIAHAARRLGPAGHPTVNDRQFRLWRAWAARGWPTLALVDPRGYVVWQQAGEPRLDALAERVAQVVAAADAAGTLDRAPRAWQGAAPDARDAAALGAGPPPLRYPGGLAASPPDALGVRRLAVANNGGGGPGARPLADRGRRLVVERTVDGGGDPFVRPQGLAFGPAAGAAPRAGAARGGGARRGGGGGPGGGPRGGGGGGPAAPPPRAPPATLYVADTGTHRVRAVDLATGAVRVVAGTGVRMRTAADRAAGAMASPWALLPLADGTLLVAMAGTHELWRVDPRADAPSVRPATARPVAGGRGEGLVDAPPGASALDALLAQPLALASDGTRVWWADAEASAVRETTRAALDGARDDGTRTLVGTGLFDFGDRDGVGDEVRLQHPQGLAWVPGAAGGRLLVADAYNDALKWLDPVTRVVTTWKRGFAEPGALAVGGAMVYVADTNAHRIVGIDGDEELDVGIEVAGA